MLAENVPDRQVAQSWSDDEVPAVAMNDPGPQTDHGVHEGALLVALKVLAAHGAHTRSFAAEGGTAVYDPAAQSVQAVQLAASADVLNDPPAQAEHIRSLVGVPSATMYDPGAQTIMGTHGVAGLLSSSNVPGAHATAGAVPPAQYSPATQAWQTVGAVLVPAAVCTVPAAHVPSGEQLDWLGALEYVPAAHAKHTRSTVFEGRLLTKVLGAQVDHEAQAEAFEAVLKVPLAHGVHTLSVVAVPTVAT